MPNMPKPVVLITETLDEACAVWLAERAQVRWAKADEGVDQLDTLLPDAEALVVRTYTQVNDALLERAPKVRVVGRAGVGLDNIDVAACRRRGIEVVYTPDANTQAVVEYLFGLMLDWARPRTALPPEADDAAFHQLRKTEVGKQLDQLTLGIVGLGRIGRRVAQVADALGMNVLGTDLIPESVIRQSIQGTVHRGAGALPGAVRFDFVPHDELNRRSDIITLHADGRPENQRMVNQKVLERFREDVLFINAARGMLVDHAALQDWAADHPAARFILDVHDPEPPAAGPLRDLPNVMLLPHLASRTHEALENMSWVVRDVMAVLDGQTPKFPAP